MFLRVRDISYISDYRLRLEFSDDVVKEVNLCGEVFEPLKDLGLFKQAVVNDETNTIEWPNGADFTPEFLDQIGKKVQQIA